MTTEFWPLPPKIKIYEALGAVADNRLKIVSNSEIQAGLFEDQGGQEIIVARQYSSSRNKYYTITYNPNTNQIMTNDNATWYVGYLGYPALSLLLHLQVITYDLSILQYFIDIPFKDINQKYNNDFTKAQTEINQLLISRGCNTDQMTTSLDNIYDKLSKMKLKPLGTKVQPPQGY
jgi:hypothetical protein